MVTETQASQVNSSCERERSLTVGASPVVKSSTQEARAQQSDLLARYQVQVLGPKEASFVIPAGTSRLDFLKQAHVASCAVDPFRRVAQQDQVERWERDPMFYKPVACDTAVSVDCLVEGSSGMTRGEQALFLKERGLKMANLADIACAHAAILLATEGRDAFRDRLRSHTVRGEGGQIIATCAGLTEKAFFVHDSQAHPALMAASYR